MIDRADRLRVMVAGASANAVNIALLELFAAWLWPLYAALFALGGALGALWLIAMALLSERFRGADLAAANVGFTFAYGLGSITGPALAGAAQEA